LPGPRPRLGRAGPVRLAAPDAISGSVMVSQAGWSSSARVVVVGAQAWTDALAASSLGAPVLYTDAGALSGAVAQEVRRLGAGEAVVIGGVQAVGTRSAHSCGARDPGHRGVGADRYQTAAKVADLVLRAPTWPSPRARAGPTPPRWRRWPSPSTCPCSSAAAAACRGTSRMTSAGHTFVIGGTAVLPDSATAAAVCDRLARASRGCGSGGDGRVGQDCGAADHEGVARARHPGRDHGQAAAAAEEHGHVLGDGQRRHRGGVGPALARGDGHVGARRDEVGDLGRGLVAVGPRHLGDPDPSPRSCERTWLPTAWTPPMTTASPAPRRRTSWATAPERAPASV